MEKREEQTGKDWAAESSAAKPITRQSLLLTGEGSAVWAPAQGSQGAFSLPRSVFRNSVPRLPSKEGSRPMKGKGPMCKRTQELGGQTGAKPDVQDRPRQNF